MSYASDGAPPTMYIGRASAALHYASVEGGSDEVLVMSESLDDVDENWQLAESGSSISVEGGDGFFSLFNWASS